MIRQIYKQWISFYKFSNILQQIESTSRNNLKKNILTHHLNLLQKQQQNQIIEILNLVINKVPLHISAKQILKYQQKIIVKKSKQIQLNITKINNINIDAPNLIIELLKDNRISQRQIDLKQIVDLLNNIKLIKGKNSNEERYKLIHNSLIQMSSIEVKFFIRILCRNLRIGIKDKLIQQSFNSIGIIQNQQIINAMLARPLRDQAEIKDFCSKKNGADIVADIKYDGQRTLIKYQRSQYLKLISRRNKPQNDVYPLLVAQIQSDLSKITDLQTVILDAQIVCVSRKDDKPLPMQNLISQRGKTQQQNGQTKNIVYIFDVIEYNGDNLVQERLIERRRKIPTGEILKKVQEKIFKYPQEYQQLKQYYTSVINDKYEGLILKGTNDKYNLTGSRIYWGKMKKGCKLVQGTIGSYDLDLIVMGADFGNGKNANNLSSFLVGTMHNGKIYPLSKVGSGFNDQNLRQIMDILSKKVTNQKDQSYVIPKVLNMDKWFRPEIVFEVSCQEFSRSPLYTFNYKDNYGGISLRFPVFQRIRDDKSINQCTSGQQIKQMCYDI